MTISTVTQVVCVSCIRVFSLGGASYCGGRGDRLSLLGVILCIRTLAKNHSSYICIRTIHTNDFFNEKGRDLLPGLDRVFNIHQAYGNIPKIIRKRWGILWGGAARNDGLEINIHAQYVLCTIFPIWRSASVLVLGRGKRAICIHRPHFPETPTLGLA